MSIHEKMAIVQERLKAPKNQWNKFGEYHYRSCEDILEAVKPILRDSGLLLNMMDDMKQIGARYYVMAVATVYDTETGESVMSSAYAREADTKKGMDPAQITGSASSYARKYALNGLFCIDDSKIEASPDPDTGPRPGKQPEGQTATEPPKYMCAGCGQEITDATFPDGKVYTARQIANSAYKKYHQTLCATCYTERRAADGNKS